MSTEYPNLPETFEAWTWSGPGEPEDLKRERLVLEAPGDQEVIVATRAIGLNPVDWKFIAMESALWQAGQIPGVDAAAEVLACSPGVTHLTPGDRIAGHTPNTVLGRSKSYAGSASATINGQQLQDHAPPGCTYRCLRADFAERI